MKTHSVRIQNLTLAALCLALCLVLPFLTGQLQQLGNALCPMHIPVLLCGFLCGPWWAAAVGFCAPFLRFALFGMPQVFPTGAAMSLELLTYGALCGLLYRALPRRTLHIYTALIAAMLGGRIVWGIAQVVFSGITGSTFTWTAFLAGAFTNAIPGIIVHIALIPVIVIAVQRAIKSAS